MRKTVFIVICVSAIFAVIMIGCAPLQVSTPQIVVTPTPSFSPMPVTVSPFYNAENHQINVGSYSEQLNTSDLQELTTIAEGMAKQKDALTPEQMFVLAIKLFDLGDDDNAVYWFYEAQFRAKLFQAALDPLDIARVGDPSFELPAAYSAFTQFSGEYINGYAGCDTDNWIRIATRVKDSNPNPPDLEKLFPGVAFVASSEWQLLNDQVGEGLQQLIDYLAENKETVKQQREASNVDARFCK